jgi:hypothetical protein
MHTKCVISWIVRSIGFGVFVVSFFLPAVGTTGGGIGPDQLQGFLCAFFSLAFLVALPKTLLTAAFSHGHDHPSVLPYPLLNSLELYGAALVLPLVVVYLLICIVGPDSRRIRRRVALAILAGLACGWCFLQFPSDMPSSDQMTPMVGHYVWIAGTLLILLPELFPNSARGSAAKETGPLHP